MRHSRFYRPLVMRRVAECARLAGMPAHRPEDVVPMFESDGTWRYVIDYAVSRP
jgi:hypothetical protein